MLIAGIGRDTVVADQRLCEDENLTTVGGIGHRLGISHERGSEDGFSRDVGFSAERLAGEDWAILKSGE